MSEQLTSLGIIPDDWEVATLGDISIKMTNGFVGIATPYYSEDENGVPYLYGNNVRAGRLDFRKLFRVTSDFHRSQSKSQLATGDMLTVQSGHIGTTAIVPASLGLANCHALIITRLRAEFAHPEFVAYCCNSAHGMQRMAAYFVGSTIAHINVKDLKSYLLPLPPLWQQRKIARILTTVDNLIEKTESLIAKYQAVKQGMMHDLFTRGVDAHGKLRPPQSEAPELYKQSELGWIPKEWEISLLGNVAEVGGGVTLGRELLSNHVVELPYLRVANVQDGYLDLSEIKTVKVLASEVDRFSLQTGDMLMTEGGDFDKLGRGTVWGGQISPCLHQNHVFRVRPTKIRIDSDFLAAVTASSYGKQYFLLNSKQTTNLASINSTQLKAFRFPLPCLEEQERIVRRLMKVEKCIEHETRYVRKLQHEKSGLMQDLLTGKVRVSVDQSEEAAAHG